MRKYRFKLGDSIKELYAVHLFDAVQKIRQSFPEVGSLTISDINLIEIKNG